MVEWAIEDLSDIVEKKEEQLEEIQRLEVRRHELLQDVQAELEKAGLNLASAQETLTLSDIMKGVNKQERESLQNIQENLAHLVKEVTTTNRTNQMLLKRSYELVNANLNIYKQSEKLARVYGSKGEYRPTGTTNLVDGAF